MPERTAAIVVIGNEILSGKTEDTNSRFLIRELRELGVRLMRMHVVLDDPAEIGAATVACAERYDYVFTSGGVGPTHDDLTIAAIARAFGRAVVRHPELERRLRDHYGAAVAERNLRMADLPVGAELVGGDVLRWPVVALGNVYILPGVPEIFRRKFSAIRERFRHVPFHVRALFSGEDEGFLAGFLDRVVAAFPDVEIGSYPRFADGAWQVKITFESRDGARVDAALAALVALLPPSSVTGVE
ncbi:MAG TPA: competence/damage-inducible protein A [Polyangia bacterium]|jgi:molybdenum cofactor synthesis domain-containing protein